MCEKDKSGRVTGRLKWLKRGKLHSKMVLKLKAVNFVVWNVITKYFM